MSFKRSMSLVFAFVIGLSLILTGCDQVKKDVSTPVNLNNPLIKTTDKYKNGYKYDPPVTVTVIRYYGPQVKFQQGESIDNNVWTKAYEDYCGIKLKSLFSVTDFTKYDLKVTTSIATNSLPDIMPIYTTLFFRVADSGRALDLKPYYDKYLDPELKTYMETAFGGTAYKTCFRNNILAALASPSGQSPSMQWIRQDWLDRYNLKWPANINESIRIMKLFCDKNPGAPSSPQTFAFPLLPGIKTGFENAFGVYYGIWEDDGNGGLARSDINPKWKSVLTTLSGMYYDGFIDNNFTLASQSDIDNQMTNQQYGFYFGAATAPDGTLYNTISYNNKAVWKSGAIMDENGTPAKMQVDTRVANFMCVNKTSKYPEALFFITNVYGDLMGGIGIDYRKYHDFLAKDGLHYDSFFYPFSAMMYPLVNNAQVIETALKTKDFSKLTGEQLGIIDKFDSWLKKKDPYGWRLYAIVGPGGSYFTQREIIQSDNLYPDRGWGPETQAWIDKGPDLSGMTSQMFVKIIRGDLTVEDGFNQWVTYFNDNGGLKATEEINAWWKTTGQASFSTFMTTNK